MAAAADEKHKISQSTEEKLGQVPVLSSLSAACLKPSAGGRIHETAGRKVSHAFISSCYPTPLEICQCLTSSNRCAISAGLANVSSPPLVKHSSSLEVTVLACQWMFQLC